MQRVADSNLSLDFSVWQSRHDGSTFHIGSACRHIPCRHSQPELLWKKKIQVRIILVLFCEGKTFITTWPDFRIACETHCWARRWRNFQKGKTKQDRHPECEKNNRWVAVSEWIRTNKKVVHLYFHFLLLDWWCIWPAALWSCYHTDVYSSLPAFLSIIDFTIKMWDQRNPSFYLLLWLTTFSH